MPGNYDQYSYFWILILAIGVFVALVWIVSRSKKIKLLDIILIWPLLLREPKSSREKYFIWGGIVVAALLIAIPQFI